MITGRLKMITLNSLVVFSIALVALESTLAVRTSNSYQFSISMPDVRPDHAEQYLCMSKRLPTDVDGQFIIGFNPKADAKRVHHMLMYSCQTPGIYQRDTPNVVWDCGGMHSPTYSMMNKSYPEGPICRGKQDIMYGWAMDAPALKLPERVGFKVGGMQTNLNFIVIQVHYGHYHAFQHLPDLTDNAGLTLDMVKNNEESGIERQAGILLLISMGTVAQGKSRHQIWCDMNEDIVIHPFRYRVHTHKLGVQVLGAKLRDSKTARNTDYREDSESIIGIGDPQAPQMFYPVRDTNLTISKGDIVYAHCEFNNVRGQEVKIGQTNDDEMCNFYLMYWTESPKLLSKNLCFGQTPRSLLSAISSLF